MPDKLIEAWTPEELKKMNEEAFLVEMLDMINLSTESSHSDALTRAIKARLKVVESLLAEDQQDPRH